MTKRITENVDWFSRDFIAVQDSAMSPSTCEQLVSSFEGTDARRPGRIGSGVDIHKKLSTDVVLEGERWVETAQVVENAMRRPVERYMMEYP